MFNVNVLTSAMSLYRNATFTKWARYILRVGGWGGGKSMYKVGELGMVVTVSSGAQRQAFRQTKKGLWEGLQSQKWVVGV